MASVFISHRGSDVLEAKVLAARLRANGHEVFLDHWELIAGDSITGWMNDRLGSSRFLLLCYSKEGVASPWISAEWQSFEARRLNGDHIALIPVYLTGRLGPALLADRKAVDWLADPHRAEAEVERAFAGYERRWQ